MPNKQKFSDDAFAAATRPLLQQEASREQQRQQKENARKKKEDEEIKSFNTLRKRAEANLKLMVASSPSFRTYLGELIKEHRLGQRDPVLWRKNMMSLHDHNNSWGERTHILVDVDGRLAITSENYAVTRAREDSYIRANFSEILTKLCEPQSALDWFLGRYGIEYSATTRVYLR